MAHAADQPQSHGQVEGRAFLAHVGRGEINSYTLSMRELETAVSQRGLDTLAAFFDGIVWQTDDVEILHAGGTNIYFGLDHIRVDTVNRGAERFEEHLEGRLAMAGNQCAKAAGKRPAEHKPIR